LTGHIEEDGKSDECGEGEEHELVNRESVEQVLDWSGDGGEEAHDCWRWCTRNDRRSNQNE